MATPTQYGRVERLVQLTPNMIRVILGGDGKERKFKKYKKIS